MKALALAGFVLLAACTNGVPVPDPTRIPVTAPPAPIKSAVPSRTYVDAEETIPVRALALSSPDFENGFALHKRFGCDGPDYSPALTWSGVPAEARSLALICEDPDAPREQPWVHWVVYDIPAGLGGFPEDVEKSEKPAAISALQGKNDFGRIGWGGPCPPRGSPPHRYFFRLYALDLETLGLPPGAEKAELVATMSGHIVGQGELMGIYERAR